MVGGAQEARDGGKNESAVAMSGSATVWGFGLAISLAGRFMGAASADQPVGYLSTHGLDASDPLRYLLTLIALPILAAVAGRWVLGSLFGTSPARWTVILTCAFLVSGFWLATVGGQPTAVGLLPLTGLFLAWLFRRRAAGWCAEDMVLLPVTLAVFLSLCDLMPEAFFGTWLVLAVIAVISMRLLLGFVVPSTELVPRAFAFAPLALVVQSSFFSPSVRGAGWPGLVIALVIPVITAFVLRSRPAIAPSARAIAIWIVFPLVAFAYPSTRGIGYAENLPRVHMFENGHSLMPASEMMRGELPWRDVIPGHGLFEDGLLDLAAMVFGDERVGRILLWRWRFASLNGIALYLLVFAATKSPEAGLGAIFAGASLGYVAFGRSVLSLLAVAAAVGGLVRRTPRYFVVSGFLLPLSGLYSVDFGVFTGFALTAAVLSYGGGWEERKRVLGMTIAGVTLAAIPIMAILMWLGILDDFLRTTLKEVLSLSPVYSFGFHDFSNVLPRPWTLPESIISLWSPASFPYLAWGLTVALIAVLLSMKNRGPALNGALVIGSWILIGALAWITRHHLYYMFAVPPLFVTIITILWRSGARGPRIAAVWSTVLLVSVVQPTSHLMTVVQARTMPRGPSEGWSEYPAIRRARGALFRESDIRNIETARAFIDQHLEPGETFFDFANVPILYFLFDRPSPIRQYEVAYYQTEDLQEEVIERLENDDRIKLAILRFPTEIGHAIDGIGNDLRAPMVARYLEKSFRIDLDTGDVVIATRIQQ